MIVVPDEVQKIQSKELPVAPDEPPPSYSPLTGSPSTSTSIAVLAHTFKTKPTNFLALSRDHDSIRGEFVIDPCIPIPSSILPPLPADQTEDDRKNLWLASKHHSVHADIWLLGSSSLAMDGGDKPRRTTIALTSSHGSIIAQLHAPDGPASFSLTARAPHGSVRLAIPRDFQGLLSLSTRHGSVTLSDTLVQNVMQLSQLGEAQKCFVGDFSAMGEDGWAGDVVEIEARGSIRLKCVEEVVADAQGKKGLFNRLFGK